MTDAYGNDVKTMYRTISDDSKIVYEEWYVVRETPRGYWITRSITSSFVQPLHYLKEKWVANNTRRPFVHDTKVAALKAFAYRKAKHAYFVQKKAEEVLSLLKASQSELLEHGINIPEYHPKTFNYFNWDY